MIAMRARAGPVLGVALSLLFAAVLTPIATAERWLELPGRLGDGDVAPITVRRSEPGRPGGGRIVAAAGALLAAVVIDRYAGFGVAVALALVTAAMMPFDSSVALVLAAQGLGAVLAL